MSRKYNTKHPDRGTNQPHYHKRLAKRGQTPGTVRMEYLETLRTRQLKRVAEGGVPWVRPGLAEAA